MTNNAIEVKNLNKFYGNLLAVDHVSFTVHQGEIFGFLDPMGLVLEESNVYTELTARDNLMFTARLYRVPRSERDARQ